MAIHCHNDAGLATAGTLAAVEAGATQVQGTVNGYGERCGNANLCEVLPNLELKMGLRALPEGNLSLLCDTARFISELANLNTVSYTHLSPTANTPSSAWAIPPRTSTMSAAAPLLAPAR